MYLTEIGVYESILFGTTIFIPVSIQFVKTLLPESIYKNFIIITISQYTNWNIVLVLVNHYFNNQYMNIFLTINSTTIFIIYHIFHCTNKHLIRRIPNVPESCTELHIDMMNIVVHILPWLFYTHDYYLNSHKSEHNIGIDVIFYNMMWCLHCFQSFDPHQVYFKISKKNVYKLWCALIFMNLFFGYGIQSRILCQK